MLPTVLPTTRACSRESSCGILCIQPFDLREMACLRHQLEPGGWDQFGKLSAIGGADNPVAFAPEHQRRNSHIGQACAQTGIVHEWLAGIDKQGRAVWGRR